MTPNARTKRYYEKLGFKVWIVEYWSPFPKPWGKRHDLFGIFDLVVLKPGEIWGVQATTNTHTADRIAKIKASPAYKAWLDSGGKIAVVGWAKMGPRGKRKVWTIKEIELPVLTAESYELHAAT